MARRTTLPEWGFCLYIHFRLCAAVYQHVVGKDTICDFCESQPNLPYNALCEGACMRNERLSKTNAVAVTDLATLLQIASRQRWPVQEGEAEHFASYRLALGQEPIQLGNVEFRILLFLASRPYYAFTRRSIADAVSSPQNPVVEDTVDLHVASLLDQLGTFHDYVQSVPYIGYRFKA
jgi:hypothetical protein